MKCGIYKGNLTKYSLKVNEELFDFGIWQSGEEMAEIQK